MTTSTTTEAGHLPVNGMQMYYESRGEGGVPLVVVHGGFGLTTVFGGLLDRLAQGRRVIAIELQGHGHTRDIDRPFTWEGFGVDVAAVVTGLGLGQADLLGWSLGAGACLQTAIRHPHLVRRLVVVSAPCRRTGWFPDIQQGMAAIVDSYAQLRATPMYDAYAAVAPDPGGFATLVAKTGALLRTPYDWTDDVRALPMPVMLVFGDADSVPPAYAAEFFGLLGGGLADGGWDRSGVTPHRLAVLPATTHLEIGADPRLGDAVAPFLE